MGRLHLRIFLTLIATVVVFIVCWELIDSRLEALDPDRRWMIELFKRLAPEMVPGPAASEAELQQELDRLRRIFEADLSLYAADGSLLASAGGELPRPEAGVTGWFAGPETRPVIALPLDGRRTLVAAPSYEIPSVRPELIAYMIIIPMLLVAAYLLARWMTRRIERLRRGVDCLGGGDLDVRVPVKGADEISELARGFNRAADRIQQLVGAQRSMLTLVSHELRSPLARLRMAIELLAEQPDPDLQRQARLDIAELDELIEQLLLASRLQTAGAPEQQEKVDMLALTAEEGARVSADVSGRPVQMAGDTVHLRRMLRNLFENARRYGERKSIEASVNIVEGNPDRLRITVSDRGPGVPEADREKIFEPFYRSPGMTEKAQGGIGLGLALVRQIARHHGGEVSCLPREGGGTIFQVDLPATLHSFT
jgi:signal transduction histidine kinase